MIICKICNPTIVGNGYCAEHSTSGSAYKPTLTPDRIAAYTLMWAAQYRNIFELKTNFMSDKIYTREELEKMFDDLVGSWKEPEWEFERHDALITYMSTLVRAMKGHLNFAIDETLRARDAEIEKLIVEEMMICHQENTPTSRLTSLAMKIKNL